MSGSGLRSAGVRLSVEGAAEAEAAFRRVGEVGDQSMGRVGSSAQRAATALREVQPAADRAAASIAAGGAASQGLGEKIAQAKQITEGFAASVSNGGNAFQALLQQAPGFLALFGVGGAVAGAASVVAQYAAKWVTAGEAAQNAARLTEAAVSAIVGNVRGLNQDLERLNTLFRSAEQNAANVSNIARQSQIGIFQSRASDEAQLQEQAGRALVTAQADLQRERESLAANNAARLRQAPSPLASFEDTQAVASRRRVADAEFALRQAEGESAIRADRVRSALEALRRAENLGVVGADTYGPQSPERPNGAAARDLDAVAREREMNRVLAERASLLRGIETPYELYARRLEEIGDLQERLPEAERLSNEQIARSTEQLAENLRRAEETSTELGNSGKLLGSAFTSAFESAIVKGEEFSVVLKALADDLAKIILRKSITEPLGNAVSGINIGGLVNSGLNAIFGSTTPAVASANGNVFAGGNVVPFAAGGVIDRPTMFALSGGRTGLMGEAGPEAIMPLERGPNGRLGIRAQGGGNVTQIINIDARNADSGTDQKIRAAITIATQQANAQLIADINRGGTTAKQVGRRS